MLAAFQLGLGLPRLIEQHTTQSESRHATLAKTQLDQTTLSGENLGRQFPAVLAGHRPLDALDDRRNRRAVVLELLGAVNDLDAGLLAAVLVVGALVGILEPAPPAHVVNKDELEIGVLRPDVCQ